MPDTARPWIYQNRAMARLHDMPDEVLKTVPTFAEIVRYRAHRGDYGPVEALPGSLACLTRAAQRV